MPKSRINPVARKTPPQKKSVNNSGLARYWQLGLFVLLNIFLFTYFFNQIYSIKYSAVGLYFNYAGQILDGALPYRDFNFEYPPLAALFFLIPRIFTENYLTYSLLYHAEILMFLLIGLWLIFEIALRLGKSPWKLLVVYTLAVMAVGPIIGEQFDIFPAVMSLASVYFFWLNKTRTSWVFLALGTLIKLYPVILAPLFILCYLRNRQFIQIWQGTISFIITCLVFALPVLINSPSSLLNLVTYHSDRALQLESTYSVILLIADKLGLFDASLVFKAGSWNIAGPLSDTLAGLSNYLPVMALIIVYWFIYTRIRPGKSQFSRIGAYSVLLILTLIIFSKILSPQYLIWLLPFLPLLFIGWKKTIWLLFALVGVLTYLIFPILYLQLIKLDSLPVLILIIRDMLLVLMAALTWISLSRMKSSD